MEAQFNIILISSEQDLPDEIKTICELFNSGLETFHVRKPHWNFEQTQQFLETLPKKFHTKIILHAHFELANKFKVKGIHLNEGNRKLITQFTEYPIISASFHALHDLAENNFPYEYVFLSPIFDSISKAEYTSKFDLKLVAEEIKKLRTQNQTLPEIIALGGINKENIALVKNAGFSGAALLGAVWQSKNPAESFLQIQLIAKS